MSALSSNLFNLIPHTAVEYVYYDFMHLYQGSF